MTHALKPSSRDFLDTNVLIYAVTKDNPRTQIAETLLLQGGVISIQVLNEFAAVARRKLEMSWAEVSDSIRAIGALCEPPEAMTLQTHESGRAIAEQYGYHIYDGLILASALQASCTRLLTEDLRHGQVIDGRLTIWNPFR